MKILIAFIATTIAGCPALNDREKMSVRLGAILGEQVSCIQLYKMREVICRAASRKTYICPSLSDDCYFTNQIIFPDPPAEAVQ